MAATPQKRGHATHNFSRQPPRTRSRIIPDVDLGKRLVRKYRKSKSALLVFPGTHPAEDPHPREQKLKHSSKKEPHTQVEHKTSANRNAKVAEEITAVPNPVPDTGYRPTSLSVAYTPSYTFKPTSSHSNHLASPTFTPLPPLLTASSLSAITMLVSPTPTTTHIAAAKAPSNSHLGSDSHKLPVAIITLLAVGSACVLIGILIIVRVCCRPAPKLRPTPSLPIYEDPFADDDQFETKESPVFGGKERFSAQTGTTSGLWAWTQYPQTKAVIAQPAAAAAAGRIVEYDREQFDKEQRQKYYPQVVPSQTEPTMSPYTQSSLQQAQKGLARAVSRLSQAATSIYPYSPRLGQDVGVAITSDKAFTADGHRVMKRASRAALRRSRSYMDGQNDELAYDGADVSSPNFMARSMTPSAAPAGGRSRIKSSYYTPGSYPRMSSIPSSLSAKTKADDGHHFDARAIQKSESHRDRDTKALAASMSFSPTSIPPSPQPTLYPDDSLSVVDAKRPSKRSQKKPAPKYTDHAQDYYGDTTPQLPMMTSPMDASTALGSLMLMDFGATNKSLATLADNLGDSVTQSDSYGGSSTRTLARSNSSKIPVSTSKRSSIYDDKPPRVPSPPPLPSLTQMGLAHANPEGYADYRSPTYSIFGLYDGDRKSRLSRMSFPGRTLV